MEPKIDINLNAQAPVLDIPTLTKDQNVPKFYGNGFQCQMTLGDSSIIVKQNEVPVAMISMSLHAMKSLTIQLNKIISLYEGSTGQTVFSFEELTQKLQEAQKKTQNK
jgi:hypothetical protein